MSNLPARIRYQGQTFAREQVEQRVAEVAALYRAGSRPLLTERLTHAAIHYLRDGALPLDNYTTR